MGSKKILFLAPYPENKAPSQRLKYEQYYSYIREAGYEITTSSFIDNQFWQIVYKKGNIIKKTFYTIRAYFRRIYDLLRSPDYDIVYVHLWVTPLGFPIFENFLFLFNKKVVYDIDDLIYLGEKGGVNGLIENLKGKSKPIVLMKKAKHVIVCTPKLDEFVKQYNDHTTDISSTINTEVYKLKSDYSIKGKLVIGWSGSHSTSKYLYLLENQLKELNGRIDFKLLVIGDSNFNIDGLDIEAIEWNESTEVMDLSRIDIGLYPLPDEEWVYGKSGLKALQYMALGIPTIATAIGANFRVIENEVSGVLVPLNNPQLWVDNIIKLAENIELRKEMGIKARMRVEEYYSIESNKSRYLHILNNI
jgi:glycosyltransferase involved in cell wall biosynthesis